MRNYSEPTARNLLRRPLVLGVSSTGIILLAFVTLGLSFVVGDGLRGNLITFVTAVTGYVLLRLLSRFSRAGWEEGLLYRIERFVRRGRASAEIKAVRSSLPIAIPDTLDSVDLIYLKENSFERVTALRVKERIVFCGEYGKAGLKLWEISSRAPANARVFLNPVPLAQFGITPSDHVYSLIQLPVITDPLWLFSIIAKLPAPVSVLLRVDGLDSRRSKSQIETARRSNSRDSSRVSSIDAEVSFEEASRVLQGISRGDEGVCEVSLCLVSPELLDLDPAYFHKEKTPELTLLSNLGVRARSHRAFVTRAVTAADLIPNVGDPAEDGAAILKTSRGLPVYFSPQDSRLEALHWLVVGASGSGKSFFTGLVLKRMVEAGTPMSVLFVDHHRSFQRLVRQAHGVYVEPQDLPDLESVLPVITATLNSPGVISGVELSDLSLSEKKTATHSLLSSIEAFLKKRRSTHPVYVVLDECWNFLRDEPILVQRAFREFRKLNGAAVAITQSLSDFLTDESGQSIFQNAPIRILLRQGEDPVRYQGVLSLNETELKKLRFLKQQRGLYSECLIKTPFLSRLARLYPTHEEHELLRTDNLRVAVSPNPSLQEGLC